MIVEGDGKFAQRLAVNLCPICVTALKADGGNLQCHCCGLEISNGKMKEQDKDGLEIYGYPV
tara:strand:+ start:1141 stop:1326 length:186 start_codon:yes stop_codon:yes gene_type:complete